MLPQTPEQIRRNLGWLSTAMDNKWKGPLGIGIGWDGLVGMVPVFGDLVTTLVSVYIVLSASQLGLPVSVLLRMALNIVLDNLVGGVPILGWLFDFMYQSNLKNLALIEQYETHPQAVVTRSRWVVGSILAGVILVSFTLIVLLGLLLARVGQWILHSL